jgi:hypothetical protein
MMKIMGRRTWGKGRGNIRPCMLISIALLIFSTFSVSAQEQDTTATSKKGKEKERGKWGRDTWKRTI